MRPDLFSLVYRGLLRPLLFSLDAESAHHLAMNSLRAAGDLRFPLPLLARLANNRAGLNDGLGRNVFGVHFPNPVGLAAGFDKNALALPAWQALGFGFIEVGTLTPRPQPGNPSPRIFRVPEQRALINRLGFNNEGVLAARDRLTRLRATGHWPSVPLGINIGKNKDTPLEQAATDYVQALEALHSFGDYFVLNVSSPNTPGLRRLQGRAELEALLQTVQASNQALPKPRPLLLKIAPDLEFSQVEEVIALAETHALSGIVATNTTVDHSSLLPSAPKQTGGLSGDPLRARSLEIVRFLAARTRLPIIAVGGISDGPSAAERLDAGASLVQLYTGFIYGGPTLIPSICRFLRSKAGQTMPAKLEA